MEVLGEVGEHGFASQTPQVGALLRTKKEKKHEHRIVPQRLKPLKSGHFFGQPRCRNGKVAPYVSNPSSRGTSSDLIDITTQVSPSSLKPLKSGHFFGRDYSWVYFYMLGLKPLKSGHFFGQTGLDYFPHDVKSQTPQVGALLRTFLNLLLDIAQEKSQTPQVGALLRTA